VISIARHTLPPGRRLAHLSFADVQLPTEGELHRRLQIVTDAALTHLDLDDLLGELLVRIRSVLSADTSAILLVDEATAELVARAAVGLEEEVEQGVRIPIGRGFAGRVVAERRPVIIPDVDTADIYNPILREKGIKSLLGVPLVVEGHPIGVLHVGTLQPREFTENDVNLLQLVADRAALAIEHARAYDAERRARVRLEQIQAVTDAALAHLDLDELFAELLQRIRSILGADTCAVLLLDEEENELVARAAVGLEEEVEQGVRIPVGRGFAGTIAAGRRPVILPDVDHADVLNPILREKGIKSMLGVPLMVRGEVIGVIHVGTLVPYDFDDDDVQLLSLVAERAALAIERARVHDEMVKLDALKLNFVAVASHELRTPATSVYGMLTTLRIRGDELAPELRAELQETAWRESDRMRRLIEQLLDLSRLDARSWNIHPQPLVLLRVLEDIVGANGDDDVELVVDPALAVVADPLVLERIVSNLVANARSYGRPPIRIDAVERDRHLRISVGDDGPGIPEELVPRLFDRFERGGEGHGSGLGLAIAKAYATAHGGDLLYHPSERGARFEVLIPRANG
jgi:signal transduction histidine kinase